MKHKMLFLCCAVALAVAMLATTAAAVENPFSDVASDSALAQAVMWAYENDITKGATDTEFKPTDTCTRGQVVTFLWRAAGEPALDAAENPFADVSTDDYYYNAVLWAVEQGITNGQTETAFAPEETCTTGHVLTFLYRANGSPDATGEGLYYEDAVNWAMDNGLTTAVDPSSESPRSDIVTYLWKNAGAPEMEVTDPEPMIYTYTTPAYAVPSSTPSLTWQYFFEIRQYLLLSGEDTFAVTFPGYTREELVADADYSATAKPAQDYVYGQHVDLWSFYSRLTYSYTEGNNTTLTFYLVQDEDTYASVSEAEAAIEDFQSQVSDLVTGFYDSGTLKETDSDMVVARYLYNWVCDNTVYSFDTSNPHSGYTTLTTGKGVCMGYAGLINALYRTAGIECYGVGCSYDGVGHTMNYAILDGSLYYIDATFGDTSYNYDKYFAMTRATVDGIYDLDDKWE